MSFIDNISFGGATAKVVTMLKDNNRYLRFIELLGQEDQVKAITATLMQGRLAMNNSYILLNEYKHTFNVIKKGNKRIMSNLGDGVVHSIIFNLKENIIIGSSEEELDSSLKEWLRNQPIPYPKEIEENLIKELKDSPYLESMYGYGGMMGVEILENKLKEDDYKIIRDIILDILGFSSDNNDSDNSDNLDIIPDNLANQKEKILNRIKDLPKIRETDGQSMKPVGLKMFYGAFTHYIVEAERTPDGDYECFALTVSNGEAEWGYVYLSEIMKLHFEMDEYFLYGSMFINKDNKIVDRDGYITSYA